MKIEDQLTRAVAEYARIFGEAPDFQWYGGDPKAWLELLTKAINTGRPLPDFFQANGIPPDAVT